MQHSTSSHSSPLHPVNLFVTVGAAPWAIAQPTLLFLSLFLHNTHQPQLNPNPLLNIVSYLQLFFKYSPCEYCCTIHSVSATLSYKKTLKSNPTLMSLISSPWISKSLSSPEVPSFFRKHIACIDRPSTPPYNQPTIMNPLKTVHVGEIESFISRISSI